MQSELCREVETFRSKTRASSFWWQRLHGCAHTSVCFSLPGASPLSASRHGSVAGTSLSSSAFPEPRVTERGIWPQRARDRLAVCLSLFVCSFWGCSHTTKLPWVICPESFSHGLPVIKCECTRSILICAVRGGTGVVWIHCGPYVLLKFPSTGANVTWLPKIFSARDWFHSFSPHSLLISQVPPSAATAADYSISLSPRLQRTHLCFWWLWKTLLLCFWEKASEHFYFLPHREAETVKLSASSGCTFPGAVILCSLK